MCKKGVLLLQDNARPHTAVLNTILVKNMNWELLPYPPYSPDLAPSDYALFPQLKKLLGGQIQHAPRTHRRIALFGGTDQILGCVDELVACIERNPPSHWYIVSEHNSHLHVAHVCPFSNQSCQCSWIDKCVMFQRHKVDRLQRFVRAQNLTVQDWRCIAGYLSDGERVVKAFGGFRENEGLCDRLKYLSVRYFTLFKYFL